MSEKKLEFPPSVIRHIKRIPPSELPRLVPVPIAVERNLNYNERCQRILRYYFKKVEDERTVDE